MERECFYVNPEGEAERGVIDVKGKNKKREAENPFLEKIIRNDFAFKIRSLKII